MTSNKFIKLKIQKLLKLIPSLEIYYEYDNFSESHFLKILPLVEFEKNDIYIQFEQDLNDEFFEKYPFELLTFLSENDRYEMVDFEKFVINKEISSTGILPIQNFDFKIAIDNLLLDYNVEMPTSVNFISEIFNVNKFKNTYEEVQLHNKTIIKHKTSVSVSFAETTILDLGVQETNNSNNNQDYSLAA